MQELVGRLTALDPEASETLKVVSYFDALIAADAGVDALLRGAAVLSAAVAGVEHNGRVSRRDPSGARPEDDPDAPRRPERRVAGGAVWIERDGAAHANDEMVVERLALAVQLRHSRRRPESGLEIAIDAARTPAERHAALVRMRVDPGARIRILAAPVEAAPQAASAVLPTPFGVVRAVLDDGGHAAPERAGLGTWVRADAAPESWDAALVAFRLTDLGTPMVDAEGLGVLTLLARAYDPASPPPDVRALARLDPRYAQALRAIVESESIRAAAVELGVHHSTLQERHDALTRVLGYDPRTAMGRARYIAAALLLRLGA